AYLLPAKYIVHTVGPVWEGGGCGEAQVLAACYRESLRLAAERGSRTLAFPSIGTGVYGYPKEEACRVAVDTVLGWLREHPLPEQVVFCCFDEESAGLYRQRLLAEGVPA